MDQYDQGIVTCFAQNMTFFVSQDHPWFDPIGSIQIQQRSWKTTSDQWDHHAQKKMPGALGHDLGQSLAIHPDLPVPDSKFVLASPPYVSRYVQKHQPQTKLSKQI